jgi:hypothetical protein
VLFEGRREIKTQVPNSKFQIPKEDPSLKFQIPSSKVKIVRLSSKIKNYMFQNKVLTMRNDLTERLLKFAVEVIIYLRTVKNTLRRWI